MNSIPVVIIGAGQAGLAVSHLLTRAGVGHVVLDCGRLAERWRSERWDSLRMLTPNWMNTLPGWPYRGHDPEGFMPAAEYAGLLQAYARSFQAPVAEGAAVRSVSSAGGGYHVTSDAGAWTAGAVVVATGYCATPAVPPIAAALDRRIVQLTPDRYRTPTDVPDGGVLVVGASATGVQLADELAAAGRDVVLSVGQHTRVPRRYRGRDILWWLDAMGSFDRPAGTAADSVRLGPSLQLVGQPRREVDIPALLDRGVRPVGRLLAAEGQGFTFADDLASTAAAADARLLRLLDRIDRFAVHTGLTGARRPERHPGSLGRISDTGPWRPRGRGIRTVLWATGYQRPYPWLHVPVLDGSGEIVHHAGRTPAPGLTVVGLGGHARHAPAFIRGVAYEAELVVGHVLDHLGARRRDPVPALPRAS